jgi:hypothetical protein
MRKANKLLYTCFVGRHVHLGYMLDAAATHIYHGRITAADVALYAFVSVSLVVFTLCAVLALRQEPYYATSVGMCYGRCHNSVSEHNNRVSNLTGAVGVAYCALSFNSHSTGLSTLQ